MNRASTPRLSGAAILAVAVVLGACSASGSESTKIDDTNKSGRAENNKIAVDSSTTIDLLSLQLQTDIRHLEDGSAIAQMAQQRKLIRSPQNIRYFGKAD